VSVSQDFRVRPPGLSDVRCQGSPQATPSRVRRGDRRRSGECRRHPLVALPQIVAEELRWHRDQIAAWATPTAYVFTTSTGEAIEAQQLRYRVWVPATRAAGLDGLRFHDLRHTAGTLAARTGAKELMARLGHASPRAALIYQHATDDRDRRIANGLDAMARDARQKPS